MLGRVGQLYIFGNVFFFLLHGRIVMECVNCACIPWAGLSFVETHRLAFLRPILVLCCLVEKKYYTSALVVEAAVFLFVASWCFCHVNFLPLIFQHWRIVSYGTPVCSTICLCLGYGDSSGRSGLRSAYVCACRFEVIDARAVISRLFLNVFHGIAARPSSPLHGVALPLSQSTRRGLVL